MEELLLALVIQSKPNGVDYGLFSADGAEYVRLITGSITEIGAEKPQHKYAYGEHGQGEGATEAGDLVDAFGRVAAVLHSKTTGPDDYSQALTVVAHRVPHGGERFQEPVLITEEVTELIASYSVFAPQGNTAALEGIRAAMETFPMAPHVAVFETAFHQSMPPEAFLYPLPYHLYEHRGLRRFGYHGIAHRHAIGVAASELGAFPEALKVVSLHLGDTSSAAAFAEGRCVDTTSGLTGQAGLVGGTTAGAIDPAAISYLLREEGLSLEELESLLAHGSGVLGLSGTSQDLLVVLDEADKENERCQQALWVVIHQNVKAIGALAAAMGGLDLLVFTGPAGAASSRIRSAICDKLAFLGLELQSFRNRKADGDKRAEVSSEGSSVKVFVVPCEEEAAIARDSMFVVTGSVPPTDE